MAGQEDYVSVGTPFPPLETEEDVEKARRKKDKEQYVLDRQGRRRFHGAFTGGFSAGYYNTVGTKEGMRPSPFPPCSLSVSQDGLPPLSCLLDPTSPAAWFRGRKSLWTKKCVSRLSSVPLFTSPS